jgi:hypothetical protein
VRRGSSFKLHVVRDERRRPAISFKAATTVMSSGDSSPAAEENQLQRNGAGSVVGLGRAGRSLVGGVWAPRCDAAEFQISIDVILDLTRQLPDGVE